ncbi:tetratricopeptide repeat protein 19, mitochondrial [Fundulus heteroclitus]|uniref:tetratricopeptide repeat protein 19, mitochondrial n=1 Tax=Fundulus heteroclitus TaxID=8078 RepID=UPI00165C83B3|nr:tetratricopeptide repeat protein 19, mitochondrial [Fundulus heteroclitus]
MAASSVLRSVLSRTLGRSRCAGGFRCVYSSAQVRPEDGRRLACWETASTRQDRKTNFYKRGGDGALWAAVAFSLFSSTDEDKRDEAQRKEDEMILLLKKAKLSLHRGNLSAASSFLHQAVALAHQTHNNQAIIYTYSQMANLAYLQGHLDSAEKLFKAAMSFMLAGGTPEDDNAVIEMSLKLATIYAEQNKAELAEHGFRFCLESLEAKLEKHKQLPEDERTEEHEILRRDTHLLLGLCLDSRARYRASMLHLNQAGQDYRKALDICRREQGETHPQTLVLMSDLATILDLQGRHDEALALIQQAVDLSLSTEHPDHHILLGNLAGILMHTGRLEDSVRFYQEALGRAAQAGDQAAMDQIQEGLKEVKKRRSQERKEPTEEAAQ